MNLSASFSLFAQALGWAVLNSLWQIAVIYLIFKALSWIFRGRNQVIYLFSLISMLASAIWFISTFAKEHSRISQLVASATLLETATLTAPDQTEIQALQTNVTIAPTLLETVENWLDLHTVQVGWAWTLCVVLLWIRLLGGWWLAQHLRRRDVKIPAAAALEQCRQLSRLLKVKSVVKLLESPHVKEPLTLGFWKPVILFPAGMLLSLSTSQVEALLLHELAHIRRHDYLINLFQLALETCFFYHPLFWFISRDARGRREFCCDDIVLQHTGDPILYAKTLTDLQLSFLHPTTQFTMNATGKSRFTERILRIAGISPSRESRPNVLIVMLLPVFIALISWWPSQANPITLDIVTPDNTILFNDSTPPQKAAPATPNAKRARVEEKSAELNSNKPAPETKTPKVAMELVKMNVFYIGVDNPIQVAVEGVPSNELILRLDGPGTIKGSDGNYTVVVTQPGEVSISVLQLVNGVETEIGVKKYRVKRIPDPAPVLGGTYKVRDDDPMAIGMAGQKKSLKSSIDTVPDSFNSKGGFITKEKLLASKNLEAIMASFDFDAGCLIVGYEVTILPKNEDAITFNVVGAEIPAKAREWFEKLGGDGDAVFFDEIKVKCPGDIAPRNIGAIAFKLRP